MFKADLCEKLIFHVPISIFLLRVRHHPAVSGPGQTSGAWALPAQPSTSPSQRYSGGMLAAVIVATTASLGKQKLQLLRCWCRVGVPSHPPHKSPSGLRSLPLPSLIAGRETPRVTFMYTTEGVQATGATRCWPTPAVGMEGGGGRGASGGRCRGL